MRLSILASLSPLALATPIFDTLSIQVEPKQVVINGTTEYSTQCKTCPYNLCPNIKVYDWHENATLTCWTNGEEVGDTPLWLKTTDDCYVTDYDLFEYEGDFSAELSYCGRIPLQVTRQDATVRYLSECKWERETYSESMTFYGRDADVTLLCWSEGLTVMDNPYWYKTTDNCHVSGTGLWRTPNRDALDNCGPPPGVRINETGQAARLFEENHTRNLQEDQGADSKTLARRWLEPGLVGEEYAPCYNYHTGASRRRVTTYEYNDTVISQCTTTGTTQYPNGTSVETRYMLTTDWCYVDSDDFWEPPFDHYRYPYCGYWDGWA